MHRHVTAIVVKLALPAGEDDNRHILAVLAYLRHRAQKPPPGTEPHLRGFP